MNKRANIINQNWIVYGSIEIFSDKISQVEIKIVIFRSMWT